MMPTLRFPSPLAAPIAAPLSPAVKNDLLIRFAAGESVTAIARHDAVRRESVEAVLREAMGQLLRRLQADPAAVTP